MCGCLAAAGAIRDACAVERIAREFQSRVCAQSLPDSADALDVAQMILRHRARPLRDVREERLFPDSQKLLKVTTRSFNHRFFLKRKHLGLQRPADEGSQQRVANGCAPCEFNAAEGAGEN